MAVELDKYLIAFLIFGAIITSGLLIFADINYNYPTSANLNGTAFNDLNTVVSEQYETSRDLQNKTLGQQTSEDNAINVLLKNSVKALRLLGNTFSIVVTTARVSVNEFGIDSYWGDVAITVFIILVAIALILVFIRLIPTG